jgi:hypothetical protein
VTMAVSITCVTMLFLFLKMKVLVSEVEAKYFGEQVMIPGMVGQFFHTVMGDRWIVFHTKNGR